jgi:hypothetical protein
MCRASLDAGLSSRDEIKDENAKREHKQTMHERSTDVSDQTYQPEQN